MQDEAVGRRFPTRDLVHSTDPLLRDGRARNVGEQLLGTATVQLARVVTRKLGRVSRFRRPAADQSGAHASVFQYPHRYQCLLVNWLMVQHRDVWLRTVWHLKSGVQVDSPAWAASKACSWSPRALAAR